MKTFKQALGLSLVALTSLAAHADLTRDQLDAISSKETGWSHQQVSFTGYDGAVNVYVTDSGTLRLAEVSPVFSATSTLDVSQSGRARANRFAEWCGLSKHTFRALARQSKKARYQYELQVFPFAAPIENGPDRTIENKVVLGQVTPHLQLNAASNTTESGSSPAAFEAVVSSQIAAQKDSILASGKATIVVDGWDDVACDFAQGSANLSFDVGVRYESPLVTRTQVLDPNQVQQIYSQVGKNWTSQSNRFKNYVWGGALLGGAFVNSAERELPEFGFDKFVNLYSQLFAVATGEFRSLSTTDIASASRNLDDLSRGFMGSTPKVNEQIVLK